MPADGHLLGSLVVKVLVTGGAGYIGAHVVRLLLGRGDEVVVVDDLSTGRADRIGGASLVEFDVAASHAQRALTDRFSVDGVDAVVHFAARKQVSESVARPAWYYQQNITGLANVVAAAESAGVDRLVFSSSAAVYGAVSDARAAEDTTLAPASPYGETKLAGEWLVRAAARAWGLREVSLRYFNVAGAGWPDLGDPAVLNLVTIVLERWRRGEPAVVHGTDYRTADGSAIRDYIHVSDLAAAHLAALDYLDQPERPVDVFNVGTGTGTSVLEMLHALAAVVPQPGAVERGPRRAGDPAMVVADPSRAREVLGWDAHLGIEDIARSAWGATATRR